MAELCTVDGCKNKLKYPTLGWCQTHYHRMWRTGSIEDPTYGPVVPPYERGYRLAHSYVRRAFGKATEHSCMICGEPAKEWAYDNMDPTEISGTCEVRGVHHPVTYSVWPEFYFPACVTCHRARDGGLRTMKRTHCLRGHALTKDNIYIPPGASYGARECRTCRADRSRERYQRNIGMRATS